MNSGSVAFLVHLRNSASTVADEAVVGLNSKGQVKACSSRLLERESTTFCRLQNVAENSIAFQKALGKVLITLIKRPLQVARPGDR
jgi:hypothetical protein